MEIRIYLWLILWSCCSEESVPKEAELLTDPGIKCRGQTTTLTCSLKRSYLNWVYSDNAIGLPITSTKQSYTITIGLLRYFFDKSVYISNNGLLLSSLSFAADTTMNGLQVKCVGPGITFTKTLRVLSEGTLPNISDPKVIDVVPGKEMYTTILKWNITDGSSTPKIWVTPHVRKDSIIVDDTSFSSLIVNISTYYNKNYTLYVSSTNCNGKKGRSFVLFKVGFCDLPPYPPLYGGVHPIKERYDQGEIVNYYCSKESMNTYHTTTCTLEGTWNPNPAQFHCTLTETTKWFTVLISSMSQLIIVAVGAVATLLAICYCGRIRRNRNRNKQTSATRSVSPPPVTDADDYKEDSIPDTQEQCTLKVRADRSSKRVIVSLYSPKASDRDPQTDGTSDDKEDGNKSDKSKGSSLVQVDNTENINLVQADHPEPDKSHHEVYSSTVNDLSLYILRSSKSNKGSHQEVVSDSDRTGIDDSGSQPGITTPVADIKDHVDHTPTSSRHTESNRGSQGGHSIMIVTDEETSLPVLEETEMNRSEASHIVFSREQSDVDKLSQAEPVMLGPGQIEADKESQGDHATPTIRQSDKEKKSLLDHTVLSREQSEGNHEILSEFDNDNHHEYQPALAKLGTRKAKQKASLLSKDLEHSKNGITIAQSTEVTKAGTEARKAFKNGGQPLVEHRPPSEIVNEKANKMVGPNKESTKKASVRGKSPSSTKISGDGTNVGQKISKKLSPLRKINKTSGESSHPPSRGTIENSHPPSRGTIESSHPPSRGTIENSHPPSRGTIESSHPPSRGISHKDAHFKSHGRLHAMISEGDQNLSQGTARKGQNTRSVKEKRTRTPNKKLE